MADELAIIGQEDPLEAAAIKGYDEQEIDSMVAYMDSTIAWMQSKNLHLETSQDVVMLRVGVPYLGSDKTVDANDVYLSDDNIDRLISTLSIDAVKFSVQATTNVSAANQLESYTYKSPYIHKIFGAYFIDGVDNRTGYSLLDNYDLNTSELASIPTEYDGIPQNVPIIPYDIPADVISCLMYIVQNPKLITVMGNSVYEPRGDVIYFRSQDFFDGIVQAKYLAELKFETVTEAELPISTEEAIRLVLEYSGIDEAFEDLEYGGILEDVRVTARFPASRDMQEQLEALLSTDANGDFEVFSDIFKEEFHVIAPKDIEGSLRKEDLQDIYNTDKTTEYLTLEDSISGNYGCMRSTEEPVEDADGYLPDDPNWTPTYETVVDYRYWYVSDEWIHAQTPEVMAIVFWLGLDIVVDIDSNPCPYDEILTIVIIIVMAVITVISAGTTSTVTAAVVASAIAQAAAIASAIVAIATTVGAIDSSTATYLTAALAVISLGTSILSGALTIGLNTATLGFVVKIANTALVVVSQIDEDAYQKEMEEIAEEQAMYEEEAKSYENEIRVQLGGYQDMHITAGSAFDYEKHINDKFSKFATYENSGFTTG